MHCGAAQSRAGAIGAAGAAVMPHDSVAPGTWRHAALSGRCISAWEGYIDV